MYSWGILTVYRLFHWESQINAFQIQENKRPDKNDNSEENDDYI